MPDTRPHDAPRPHDTHARGTGRPLGAFERIIDLYIERNPVHFSLAMELRGRPTPGEVRSALDAVQTAHPLLGSTIDRAGGHPRFIPGAGRIPVRAATGSSWSQEAAREQTIPFGSSDGPLLRAVMIDAGGAAPRTTLLVTFSHQIADGRGALRVARDLLDVLDGSDLPARDFPASQEELLESAGTPVIGLAMDAAEPEPAPERRADPVPMPAPARRRPVDGQEPRVESSELDAAATMRVREAARAHSSSVQGALCAAAASVFFQDTTRDVVRINVPIDLRTAGALEDDVAIRFTATTVSIDRSAATFWDAARVATTQLRAARAPAAARAAALGLAGLPVSDAEAAEAAMLMATNADIEITNLGVSQDADGATAIWGPVMTTQVEGEQILGVITHGGRLRLTLTAHDPRAGLLENMIAALGGVDV